MTENGHLLLKCHRPDKTLQRFITRDDVICICTIRKPEDAIASWMRIFNFDIEKSIEELESWLSWHAELSQNLFNIGYQEIDRWPLRATKRISRHIVSTTPFSTIIRTWWKYRKSSVKKKTDKLEVSDKNITDAGFTYYDNDTFFHRKHISSISSQLAEETLSLEDIAMIRNRLSRFVDPDGNYNV